MKITLKEDVRNRNLPHNTHSYEATKIELLEGTLVKPEGDNPNTSNSISAAKLLKDVEMSYNPSVKVLDASKERSEKAREQRVFHGSSADFDRFDHSHMGEGEGAQAYGWGTYVTEVEGIGKAYAEVARRNAGVRREGLLSNINRAKAQLPFMREGEYKTELERQIAEWEEESAKPSDGRLLYTIEIPDDNGQNYLDWKEKPTKQQKETIIRALMDFNRIDVDDIREMLKMPSKYSDDDVLRTEVGAHVLGNSGSDLYHSLSVYFGNDEMASKFLAEAGFAGIKYPADYQRGGRADGAKNYVIFNEANAKIVDKVRYFRTANGEAYGFTVAGKIYIDPRIADSDTPTHEYAHLWASALRACNHEEWKNVVALMKGTSVWDEVKERYPDLKTDDEMADEVLAHYSGRRGAERLREEARKIADGNGGVLEKAEAISALERVKRALDAFWKGVCDFLHIHYTSAEEVADRVMKDLLDGVDPRKTGKKEKSEVEEFAERHGVNEEYVDAYAKFMKMGDVRSAHYIMAEIRRTLRMANRGLKLSEFKEVMKPIQAELYERFGDLDALQEAYEKEAAERHNIMEVARKKAEEEEAARRKHMEELAMLADADIDKRYMDALEKGDEATAREMLDEAARRKGYGDVTSGYQGVGAWAAPSNPGYETDEERRADVEENAPDVNVEDIALGYSSQPADYFANPRAYGQDTEHGRESTRAIRAALDALKRGEKDVKVKVYRAVPTSVKEGKLRNGDWVTPSKKYAEMHGNSRLEGHYRIMEDEVPASQLWWDGNNANEWGFDDGKRYKYKNVKNNRKSDDLVTRDDRGEVILPSQRFNQRKKDVRYQFVGEKGASAADHAEEVTTRLDNLAAAREMEEAKKDAKAIKMATGWERGADGKWRYEIGDAKIVDEKDFGRGYKEKRDESDMLWTEGKLCDVVDAPDLLKAYPELKDIRIVCDELTDDQPSNGSYNPKTKTITIHATEVKYLNSILNHEIQHAIQEIEGFAQGGNTKLPALKETPEYKAWEEQVARLREESSEEKELNETIAEYSKEYNELFGRIEAFENSSAAMGEGSADLLNRQKEVLNELEGEINELVDKLEEVGHKRGEKVQAALDSVEGVLWNLYDRLAGEVEARNVEKRMGMTPEERRASLASETEDVAREDQIFLMGEGGESHMGSRVDKRMAEIGKHYEGKDLTDAERAVVDVFSGKRDRQSIEILNDEGTGVMLEMRQGNEMNAGCKHSIFRHVGTKSGSVSFEELRFIPDVVKSGERIDKGANVVYRKEIGGVRFTVYTDKKGKKEIFHDFYSNRKTAISESLSDDVTNTQSSARTSDNAVDRKASSFGTSNTPEEAHTSNDNALSVAKVERNSETANEVTRNDAEDTASYRIVDDPALLNELEDGGWEEA